MHDGTSAPTREKDHPTNDPRKRVDELLATYGVPDACLGELLCDTHPADAVAFTVVEADLSTHELSYGDLQERSRRFAVALAELGIGPGDRVATLMGKSGDLVATLLGIWRRGAVHVPLFTAFAPPAIASRLHNSGAKLVVVDADQAVKLQPGVDMPAEPFWQTIVVGPGAQKAELTFSELLARHRSDDPRAKALSVGGDAEFVRLFTSGTTGTPKGVSIPVRAIASFRTYLEYGIGLEPDDVYWNAADPGWAYGLYYGIIAPLAAGRPNILLHAGFSAELTYRMLATFRVTNFTTAPTVYRVMRSEPEAAPSDLVLRRCSSAGEPLNPDLVAWAQNTLGAPIHDCYGQTELGMCVVNGWHPDIVAPVRPGSMGHPMPGWSVEVLRDEADEIAPAGTVGRVAVDVLHSPLMWFTGYADNPTKTAERFSDDGRWYYTGDAGSADEEGYLRFSSRDDDVIIMAGYRIGPFDVESVLASHPDVVETAVVGVPDDLRGEVLEAFVVLRAGVTGSDALVNDLQQLVKQKFAAHAYPRTVHFVAELPKTASGKIQRFALRDQRRAEVATPMVTTAVTRTEQ
nr:AMP-binding protein [Kineosphaera limosa]